MIILMLILVGFLLTVLILLGGADYIHEIAMPNPRKRYHIFAYRWGYKLAEWLDQPTAPKN